MKELLSKYIKIKERKQRIIKPLVVMKNSIEGFEGNQLKEIQYNVLLAEIQMLDRIIDDLTDSM